MALSKTIDIEKIASIVAEAYINTSSIFEAIDYVDAKNKNDYVYKDIIISMWHAIDAYEDQRTEEDGIEG